MSYDKAKRQWKAGQIPLALESMASAEQAKEDSFDFHQDYSTLHMLSGNFVAALVQHDKARNKKPEWEEAPFRRGLMHLIEGQYAQGWPLFLQRKSLLAPHLNPKWKGQPLPGGTILLYTDQGLGDAVQFSRYINIVKNHCSHLKLLCKPDLIELLSTAFVFDEVFPAINNTLPPPDAYDCWLGIADLPAIFQTFVGGQLPPAPTTFQVNHAKVSEWQERFDAMPGYRVGVAWRGSSANPLHQVRDIPATAFKALSQVPGVRLVTLQQAPRADEVSKLGRPKVVTDLTKEMDKPEWSLMDTAAVLLNLDLVITCDTMVAHLSASLGKDTWIALPPFPDWRWGLIGNTTPWYPDIVRLFRQPPATRWEQYIKTVANSLEQHPGVAGLAAI